MKWIDKKEELKKFIVDDNKSYEEIGRIYGVSGAYIKKVAVRFGIPITARRAVNPNEVHKRKAPRKGVCINCGKEFILYPSSTGKFCSKQCSSKYKSKQKIKEWKDGLASGTCAFTCSGFVKAYMLEKANYKCEKCGWDKINPYTGKVPLQIHHIDGNSLNNKEENLQVLCPNCHALTDNFGSRNKNAPNGKSHYYRRS